MMGDWYSYEEEQREPLWIRMMKSLVQFECDCEECEHNVDEEQW